jgi:hypothetical protein
MWKCITFAYTWIQKNLTPGEKYPAKHNVMTLDHLPHFSGLFLPKFLRLKTVLTWWFTNTRDAKVAGALTKLSKKDFQECFQNMYTTLGVFRQQAILEHDMWHWWTNWLWYLTFSAFVYIFSEWHCSHCIRIPIQWYPLLPRCLTDGLDGCWWPHS